MALPQHFVLKSLMDVQMLLGEYWVETVIVIKKRLTQFHILERHLQMPDLKNTHYHLSYAYIPIQSEVDLRVEQNHKTQLI